MIKIELKQREKGNKKETLPRKSQQHKGNNGYTKHQSAKGRKLIYNKMQKHKFTKVIKGDKMMDEHQLLSLSSLNTLF